MTAEKKVFPATNGGSTDLLASCVLAEIPLVQFIVAFRSPGAV